MANNAMSPMAGSPPSSNGYVFLMLNDLVMPPRSFDSARSCGAAVILRKKKLPCAAPRLAQDDGIFWRGCFEFSRHPEAITAPKYPLPPESPKWRFPCLFKQNRGRHRSPACGGCLAWRGYHRTVARRSTATEALRSYERGYLLRLPKRRGG